MLQMFFKHRIGQQSSKLDLYLFYQVAQNLLLGLIYAAWIPYILLATGNIAYVAFLFLVDVALMFALVLFAAVRVRRSSIVVAFPIIYVLRWVSLVVFFKAFIEVIIFEKYRYTPGVWETTERRHQKAPVLLKR